MNVFRILVALAWLAAFVTLVIAVDAMGVMAAGTIFIDDFQHPWRAQFNSDFSGHLLLMALWIGYREPSPIGRYVFPLLAVLGGGVFSFAYLLVATYRERGDVRGILLGRQKLV